jgi:hypothetical protein
MMASTLTFLVLHACVLPTFCLRLSPNGWGDNLDDVSFSKVDHVAFSKAYVTLVDNNPFFLAGLQGLAMSLKQSKTTFPLIVVTTEEPSKELKATVSCMQNQGFDMTSMQLPQVDNPIRRHPARYNRTFDKLDIWAMPLDRLVFLDADTVVLKNIDELLDASADFRAAPDCGFDCHEERFNSGVLAIKPSKWTYQDMMGKLSTTKSYDGGDQGFLNEYYNYWSHTADAKLSTNFNKLKRRETHKGDFDLSSIHVIHNVGTKPWAPNDPDGKTYPKSHGSFHKFYAIYKDTCPTQPSALLTKSFEDTKKFGARLDAFLASWRRALTK